MRVMDLLFLFWLVIYLWELFGDCKDLDLILENNNSIIVMMIIVMIIIMTIIKTIIMTIVMTFVMMIIMMIIIKLMCFYKISHLKCI